MSTMLDELKTRILKTRGFIIYLLLLLKYNNFSYKSRASRWRGLVNIRPLSIGTIKNKIPTLYFQFWLEFVKWAKLLKNINYKISSPINFCKMCDPFIIELYASTALWNWMNDTISLILLPSLKFCFSLVSGPRNWQNSMFLVLQTSL